MGGGPAGSVSHARVAGTGELGIGVRMLASDMLMRFERVDTVHDRTLCPRGNASVTGATARDGNNFQFRSRYVLK